MAGFAASFWPALPGKGQRLELERFPQGRRSSLLASLLPRDRSLPKLSVALCPILTMPKHARFERESWRGAE
jgi:hypothetical protein